MASEKAIVSANDGSSSSSGTQDNSPPQSPPPPHPPAPCPLNPNAQEWDPEINGAIEEERTLFITFSKGHPITEPMITWFFDMKYGPCVERVYIHCPDGEEPPMFGKIVFNSALVPIAIMGTVDEVQFNVNGKSLLCKKYQRKH